MLEDETDVYLSTGCDFIEPLEHTHVTEHNVTPTTPLSMKDIHSGQTGGGIRIESTGPAPGNALSLTTTLTIYNTSSQSFLSYCLSTS